MKHVIRPTAKDDIIRQFRYYLLADAFDTATRFLEAVDASIETLLAMPEIGVSKTLSNPRLEGLRCWPVKDFDDILIFYVIRPETLRIVRILHGTRDINKILEREKDDSFIN